jgi:signal transduction histidine kinase
MRSVTPLPPLRILQLTGLLAGGVIGGGAVLDASYAAVPEYRLTTLGVGVSTLVLWAFCYWRLSASIRQGGLGVAGWLLLLMEIAAALLTNIQLMILAAAQMPVLAPGRRAFGFLGFLVGMELGVAGLAYAQGGFEVSEEFRHLPFPAGVVITILQILVWTLFAFLVGYLIVQLELQKRQMTWTNGELLGTQRLLADATRINERVRIARELHDTAGHHLVSLGMHLEIADHHASGPASEAIGRGRLVAKLLLREIREIVGEMREEREVGLSHALELLRHSMPDLKITMTLHLPEPLSAAYAHTLFRACEEALTNVHRHAQATEASIFINAVPGRLNLVVRDNGVLAGEVKPGNGLRGMRERFRECEGDLAWSRDPGKGFTISGWLPLLKDAA